MITAKLLKQLREEYPQGKKLQLIHMDDPYPVPPGTIGEVFWVDDIGDIHMKWETGQSLALIPGVDEWREV